MPIPFVTETLALGGISGGLGYLGQREANETNRDIAREATNTNIAEARRNREFQREMSNTAFQRQKEDLIKAGINPLLMAGMSGASTPSGSTGSAETAKMENTMQGVPAAISSAIDMRNSYLAGEKQAADIALIDDQKKLTKAQTGKAVMETQVMSKGIPEADLKNKVYKWATEKFGQAADYSSKNHSERMDDLLKIKPFKLKGQP